MVTVEETAQGSRPERVGGRQRQVGEGSQCQHRARMGRRRPQRHRAARRVPDESNSLRLDPGGGGELVEGALQIVESLRPAAAHPWPSVLEIDREKAMPSQVNRDCFGGIGGPLVQPEATMDQHTESLGVPGRKP